MKKIFNWTFGSIFRTFGRIIAYLVVGGLLALLISHGDIKLPSFPTIKSFSVEAPIKMSSSPNWAQSLPFLQQTIYKDCTGSSTCNNTIATSNRYAYFDDDSSRRYIANDNSVTIASNGILIMNNFGNLKSGYIYQVNYYLCANDTINPSGSSFYISPIDYDNPGVKHNSYELFSSSSVSDSPFSLNSESFGSCRKYESLIVPNGNYNWLGIRLKNISNVGYIQTIAYEVEELGIYTTELETVVNRAVQSATANLVTSSQLNTATQQIQTEQQNTTQAVESGLTTQCSNTLRMNYFTAYPGVSGNYSSGEKYLSITPTGNIAGVYYQISVESNKTYYLKGSSNGAIEFHISTTNNYTNAIKTMSFNGGTFSDSFNTGNNTTLYVIVFTYGANVTTTLNNFIISKDNQNFCVYGSSSSKLDETNQGINNLNDSINNDDSSSATSEASSFFSSFTTDSHGLTGIITAPLNAINSLTSATCSPLHIPIPFLDNKYLDLPCMRAIYIQYFGDFMSIYDIITLGIIAYWVMVRIFALVKDFKNPEHDEVEVVDL